jgi:hypothetical protein
MVETEVGHSTKVLFLKFCQNIGIIEFVQAILQLLCPFGEASPWSWEMDDLG